MIIHLKVEILSEELRMSEQNVISTVIISPFLSGRYCLTSAQPLLIHWKIFIATSQLIIWFKFEINYMVHFFADGIWATLLYTLHMRCSTDRAYRNLIPLIWMTSHGFYPCRQSQVYPTPHLDNPCSCFQYWPLQCAISISLPSFTTFFLILRSWWCLQRQRKSRRFRSRATR